MNPRKKDLHNAYWLSLQYIVSILVSFVGLKLNFLTFGSNNFGKWILLVSFWGMGAVLDFGFGMSTIRFIAKNYQNKEKLRFITATNFFVFLFLGAFIMIFGDGVTVLHYVFNRTKAQGLNIHIFKNVSYILGLNFYFSYLATFFKAIFEGHGDFKSSAKISIVYSVFQFIGVVLVYVYSLNFLMLAIVGTIASTIQLVSYILFSKKKYVEISISWKNFRFFQIKEIFLESINIQVTYLLASLIDPAVKYTLGIRLGGSAISMYELARRFVVALSGLYATAMRHAFPKISILGSAVEYKVFLETDGVRLSKLGVTFSGIGFGILAVVFFILSGRFYKMGDAFPVLLILALIESTNVFSNIIYVFIIGIGRAKLLTGLQFLNVVFTTIFLNVGLILFHNLFGLVGLFFSVFIACWAMFIFVSKISKLNVFKLLIHANYLKLILLYILIICDLVVFAIYPSLRMSIQFLFAVACFLLFFGEGLTYLQTMRNLFR